MCLTVSETIDGPALMWSVYVHGHGSCDCRVTKWRVRPVVNCFVLSQ
jgi:hypothetical protein